MKTNDIAIDNLMCNNFKSILQKLPSNRAAGKYGIFAEPIFMLIQVCVITSIVYLSVYLMHGKIALDCMQTLIVLICKNKNGDISDPGEYRPVSLDPAFSKLCGHYILPCISPFVATTDNQYRFKPQHGTVMCILVLKQTVSYYVS